MAGAKCEGWSPGGFTGYTCSKDLKTDEQIEAKLCGRHLAGKRRRAINDKARDEKHALNKKLRAKAVSASACLGELGVKAYPHYSANSSGYTGRVVISDVEALVKLLEGKKREEPRNR